MEECDIVTSVTTRDDVEDGEEQVEGMEDCVVADGVNMTEMFPVSPSKRRGDNETEQVKVLEEKPLTISVPTSPKSTVATTTSADVDHASIDSALVLNEVLEEGASGSIVPTLQKSSVDNTANDDVQQANIVSDSVLTVVLEKESSGSDNVLSSPKSSEPNTASADVSQEENNDSDSVLPVALEEESSGSDNVPSSPKSSESSSASSHVVQQSNIDSAVVLNEILEEDRSRSDSVPTSQKSSEPNTASADVAQQANKDELEEKPSTSGSVSIWEKSPVPSTMIAAFKPADVDLNKVNEEEVKSATEANENEALILNDKSLLAQSLIAKLMNLLLEKRLYEVNLIKKKSNSRKRPSSAISAAGASCGSNTSDPLTRGPPQYTIRTGCTLMDYYIYKQKEEGKDYDCSQLLIDNPGLEMELNYYTERMKSFIMLPAKHPNKTEEIEGSNPSKLTKPTVEPARKEDKTNGAHNSKMTDLT